MFSTTWSGNKKTFWSHCLKIKNFHLLSNFCLSLFFFSRNNPIESLMLLVKLKCRLWYFSRLFVKCKRYFKKHHPSRIFPVKKNSVCDLSEPLDILFISNDGVSLRYQTFSTILSFFKKAYILLSLLNHEIVSSRERQENTDKKKEKEKQAHNSIKYLFDSNVFIDEKRLGMFFNIFLFHLLWRGRRHNHRMM